MKIGLLRCLCVGSCSYALAKSSSGSSANHPPEQAGPPESTRSNGSTISGTGGSPGPKTSNALNHGTAGNNLGPPSNSNPAAASHSKAVNTPAANSATSRKYRHGNSQEVTGLRAVAFPWAGHQPGFRVLLLQNVSRLSGSLSASPEYRPGRRRVRLPRPRWCRQYSSTSRAMVVSFWPQVRKLERKP
jgi:hypothetical protein